MSSPSPLGVPALTDEYFIENRNRLLEIAAFLDRLDRADPARGQGDFRIRAACWPVSMSFASISAAS